jgi:hypothetical protein
MREFDVPVLVTVRVRVDETLVSDDDGYVVDVWDAEVDPEAGPWAYSSYPVAFESEPDGVWYGQMQDEVPDGAVEAAWHAAYDALRVEVGDDVAAGLVDEFGDKL